MMSPNHIQSLLARSLAAGLALIVCLIGWSPSTAIAQGGDPFCPPGRPASFVLGIAALRERLGTIMGEPIECEHVDPASGDTVQHTTTGLAYYRPEINTAIFTNGEAHWALADNRLILWRGVSLTPRRPTPSETAYLDLTQPISDRIDALRNRLEQLQALADRGRLGEVELAELSDLIGELTRTRQGFATADESERLKPYDGFMMRSLDEALASAGQLLRARLTDVPEARDAFVAEAADHLAASERLQWSANDAFSEALPIVVG